MWGIRGPPRERDAEVVWGGLAGGSCLPGLAETRERLGLPELKTEGRSDRTGRPLLATQGLRGCCQESGAQTSGEGACPMVLELPEGYRVLASTSVGG